MSMQQVLQEEVNLGQDQAGSFKDFVDEAGPQLWWIVKSNMVNERAAVWGPQWLCGFRQVTSFL